MLENSEKLRRLRELEGWTECDGSPKYDLYHWIAKFQQIDQKPSYGTPEHKKVVYLRGRIKDGLVSEEHIFQLESIPWWSEFGRGNIDIWVERFREMDKPKKGTPENTMLTHYRNSIAEGKVSADDIAKFETIPWWDSLDRSVKYTIEDIRSAADTYVEKNGRNPTKASG